MSAVSVEEVLEHVGAAPTVSDFRRDHHDRPLVVPPQGGKPVPYARASSGGKLIDDTFALEKYARRLVAFGMAHDASLVARTLAVVGTPQTWDSEQKKAVNEIVSAAEGVAQAHKAADIGTALHRLVELANQGVDVHAGIYQPDLDAYRARLDTEGIITTPELVECRLVSDELQMAGTCDSIVALTPTSALRRFLRLEDDEHLIADLKTGESVEYGALSWSVQLAAYAHGELYDLVHDVRLPTPKVNRRRGLIIHLPAGKGVCDLYLVDLEAGYRAALLTKEIRATRSAARGWMEPLTDATPLPTSDEELDDALAESVAEVDPEVITATSLCLRSRLNAAVQAGAVAITWPSGVARFRDGGPRSWSEMLLVEAVVAAAEAEAGLPFDAPSLPRDPNAEPDVAPVADVVELAPRQPRLDPESIEALRAAHHALPVDLQRAAFGAVMAAGLPTDRRLWTEGMAGALADILGMATAEHGRRNALVASTLQDVDDELVGAVLRAVVDDEAIDLERLTGDQAEALVALAEALDTGALGAELDDEGVMCIVSLPTTEAALLFAFDGKAALLADAKDMATLHGRPKPRSAAAAATDPVLAALLLASTP